MDEIRSLIIFVGGVSIFIASLAYAREFLKYRAKNREMWELLEVRMMPSPPERTRNETDLGDLTDRLATDAARLRQDVDELEARIRMRGEGQSPAR